jgi:YVTN family beta-propeller protein
MTMSELSGQRVVLANRSVPYGLGFNPITNRLYLTHTDQGFVTQLSVYAASVSGLAPVTTLTIPDGGRDTSGSLGINSATDHIFVPNAASDSISVIDGAGNKHLAVVTPFPDPFGIATHAARNRVYVGARSSDELWVVPDIY